MADRVGRVAVLGGGGEAHARSPETGLTRLLKIGDPVFDGDRIVSGPGVEVELVFERAPAFVLRENETLMLDEFVFASRLAADVSENVLLSGGRQFDQVSEALGTGSLANFLHFEWDGASTKVHISSGGGFGGGYTPAVEDQTIVLAGVNLVDPFGTDQQIIQDLLTRGKLIID